MNHFHLPLTSILYFLHIPISQQMLNLLKRSRFHYQSILQKYPNGLGNRMQRFDQWTKTWNDPNFNTYYDYFYNGEVPKHEVLIPDSESSKSQLAQAATMYRPGLFRMHNDLDIFDNPLYDDHLLSVDNIEELRFSKFLKDCLKAQTRKDLHTFFIWSCLSFVLAIIAFYRGVIKTDYKQQVIQLQPDQSFYRYNPNILQEQVQAFIQKVNLINQHSKQQLQAARARALARRSLPTPK